MDIIVGRIDLLHTQQCTRLGEVRLALAVRQQAVMADAVQAFRQHVDEEAVDELMRVDGHRFLAAGSVVSVVSVDGSSCNAR